MTSASELFNTRRYRLSRNHNYTPSFDPEEIGPPSPTPSRNHRRHHSSSSNNHHGGTSSSSRRDRLLDLGDGCDPLRRPRHRPPPALPEHETTWPDQGGSQLASRNANSSIYDEGLQNRSRFTSRDRLPGAVILARERLLQRLRGAALSGNRRSNRVPSRSDHVNFSTENDFALADVGDWETEVSREWLAGISSFGETLGQETRKRPPGLAQKALECLPVEIFCSVNINDKDAAPKTLSECSICLESFMDGDELICLPCRHKFHSCCLIPWVRTCGDCPNCKAVILDFR